MKDTLYDALLLLQSFLQYNENLIYMDRVFNEILSIISSCDIQNKIECFNVLSIFFGSDDIYYTKLIDNQTQVSLLFSNLEENNLLIEAALNFANEVVYSNSQEVLNFIKLSKN